jgi:hypothetical protein
MFEKLIVFYWYLMIGPWYSLQHSLQRKSQIFHLVPSIETGIGRGKFVKMGSRPLFGNQTTDSDRPRETVVGKWSSFFKIWAIRLSSGQMWFQS